MARWKVRSGRGRRDHRRTPATAEEGIGSIWRLGALLLDLLLEEDVLDEEGASGHGLTTRGWQRA